MVPVPCPTYIYLILSDIFLELFFAGYRRVAQLPHRSGDAASHAGAGSHALPGDGLQVQQCAMCVARTVAAPEVDHLQRCVLCGMMVGFLQQGCIFFSKGQLPIKGAPPCNNAKKRSIQVPKSRQSHDRPPLAL